jgi:hypothetical protein
MLWPSLTRDGILTCGFLENRVKDGYRVTERHQKATAPPGLTQPRPTHVGELGIDE